MESIEKYIEAPDGTSIFVSIEGSGPALILSDGLGCNGFIWRYLKPMLVEHFQVIHWHYPGHGFSQMPCDPEKVGLGDFCEILKTILDALGVEKTILCGHSLGVHLSLEFTLAHAERVRGLILCCGSYADPVATFHDSGASEYLFEGLNFITKRHPSVVQGLWSGVLGSGLGFHLAKLSEINSEFLRPADMKPYFDHLAKMNVELYFRIAEKSRGQSTELGLNEIKQPTYIIAGENDTFTPCWLSKRMAQKIEDAQLQIVDGGTHVAPLEDHLAVNKGVKEFLEGANLIEKKPLRPKTKKSAKRKTVRKLG